MFVTVDVGDDTMVLEMMPEDIAVDEWGVLVDVGVVVVVGAVDEAVSQNGQKAAPPRIVKFS